MFDDLKVMLYNENHENQIIVKGFIYIYIYIYIIRNK